MVTIVIVSGLSKSNHFLLLTTNDSVGKIMMV